MKSKRETGVKPGVKEAHKCFKSDFIKKLIFLEIKVFPTSFGFLWQLNSVSFIKRSIYGILFSILLLLLNFDQS